MSKWSQSKLSGCPIVHKGIHNALWIYFWLLESDFKIEFSLQILNDLLFNIAPSPNGVQRRRSALIFGTCHQLVSRDSSRKLPQQPTAWPILAGTASHLQLVSFRTFKSATVWKRISYATLVQLIQKTIEGKNRCFSTIFISRLELMQILKLRRRTFVSVVAH